MTQDQHVGVCCVHPWSRFDVDLHFKVTCLVFFVFVTSLCFDIGIPYLANGSITIRGCVWNNDDFGYDVELWHKGQIYRVYDMALCSGHRLVVLSHSHTMWVYHLRTMCTSMTSIWPWPLILISKLYFHHELETGNIILALWHRHTNVDIYFIIVKQHVVYIPCSCPLYDIVFWHICGWRVWVSLVRFTYRFSNGHFIPWSNHLIGKLH